LGTRQSKIETLTREATWTQEQRLVVNRIWHEEDDRHQPTRPWEQLDFRHLTEGRQKPRTKLGLGFPSFGEEKGTF